LRSGSGEGAVNQLTLQEKDENLPEGRDFKGGGRRRTSYDVGGHGKKGEMSCVVQGKKKVVASKERREESRRTRTMEEIAGEKDLESKKKGGEDGVGAGPAKKSEPAKGGGESGSKGYRKELCGSILVKGGGKVSAGCCYFSRFPIQERKRAATVHQQVCQAQSA